MAFTTKLDYSDNRQIKQRLETSTKLSGGTIFGLPFNDLTKGPNIETSGVTENNTFVASTFSGNNTTTIYNWYDSRMQLGYSSLSALTPLNSGETQTVLPTFAPASSIVIDGNTVNTLFSGVTFDLTNIIMTDLGGGNYAGTVEHTFFDVLSASTAEYTGRTIWVDVSGITRTDRLIVSNNPQVGYVLTCNDSEGMASWAPSGGSSGGTSYWSAGTGTDAITTLNSNNVASGIKSLAQGNNTQANGFASHAQGNNTKADGSTSHAEGNNTIASGDSSHAEGIYTQAFGDGSHAEGVFTLALGDASHAEGYYSRAFGLGSHAGGGSYTFGFSGGTAIGDGSFVHGENSYSIGKNSVVLGRNITGNTADTTYVDNLNIKTVPIGISINNLGVDATGKVVIGSGGGGTSYWSAGTGTNAIATLNGNNVSSGTFSLAQGLQTQAIGDTSHAEGYLTQANGDYSHAEGYSTQANGEYSHAEGFGAQANGQYSHAEGSNTRANGQYSHAEGLNTIASGQSSHAQGYLTKANNFYTHASGDESIANGITSFVHGSNSVVNGDNSIVLGRNITGNTADTTYVDNLNIKTLPVGTSVNNLGIDATGKVVIGSSGGSSYWSAGTGTNAISTINGVNVASGNYALSEGFQTQAIGNYSHAEGLNTISFGRYSHAEGSSTQANGDASHAEGVFTLAIGQISHAEGSNTIASGENSHAEGENTKASGQSSHAEGRFTEANGYASHAGGNNSRANGLASFVHGESSRVNGDYSIVLGRNITGNTADTTYVDNLNIKTVSAGPGTIDIGVNASGFVVNQASDRRLKENINTIENALDAILKLRGVTYNWKDRVNGGDGIRYGFIAQEVQETIPDLVTYNGEYLGVQYKDIPALLVEAIKELVSGNTEYSKTYLETQTILAEDNNIELNYSGTKESSIGGGITIVRGEDEPTTLALDEDGNWVSNVNIFSKGFVIPKYTPSGTNDSNGVVGNMVQDDNYIYTKTSSGWKRSAKLEDF